MSFTRLIVTYATYGTRDYIKNIRECSNICFIQSIGQ